MKHILRLVLGLLVGGLLGLMFYRLALPEVAANAPKQMEQAIVGLWTLTGGLIALFR